MPSEAETVALPEGWVLVHAGPWQNDYRAEKYGPNGKIEAAAPSEELLLQSIEAYEEKLAAIEIPLVPEHAAIAEAAEPEEALRTVTGPDGELYTEAEWAARDSGYEPTAEAHAEGQEAKKDAADQAGGSDEVESETLELVNTSNQPSDILSVYPGEESINDVIERKAEESAASESERGAENQGIGPHGPGENAPEGYMGGEPETYDPGPEPTETELAMQAEREAQLEALTASEMEKAGVDLAAAEEAAQAAAEAEENAEPAVDQGANPVPAGEAPPVDTPEGQPEAEVAATPAAIAKAEELGVDISTVEGTGAGGNITVSDVTDAAS